MKTKILLFGIALVFLSSLAMGAEVSQGKCIKYDREQNIVVIEEYNTNFSKEYPYGRPTGQVSTFRTDKAKIGILPSPGDILRIAYQVKGTERLALKIMNVSKQDLRSK
ncbi:MAG: hypothetical protein ACK4WB_04615 [Desulfatiglandales bacterium]